MQNRLLLVDDDASLLKLLVIRLEAEGYEVLRIDVDRDIARRLSADRPAEASRP